MHETLSVIDEHITDLRTPRQSYLSAGRTHRDAESIYNAQAGYRLSYINGHETDEEEEEQQQQQQFHTEAEIMAWTPTRVAKYLQDHGVEKQHCEIFKEQEISGEVLLHMEQSAVFIKEFELGSVGRRLKTWQKVKELQDEARSNTVPQIPRSVSDYSVAGDDGFSDLGIAVGRSRSASVSGPTASPRPSVAVAGLSPHSGFAERPSTAHQPVSSAPPSAPSYLPSRAEHTSRPSAASVRNINHSRRHSSIGSIDVSPPQESTSRFSHHRNTSGPAPAAVAKRYSLLPELRNSGAPSHYDGPSIANFGFGNMSSSLDADRGYFSGNELDNRNKRNTLQKKNSPLHSRSPSTLSEAAKHTMHFRKNGRMASAESIMGPEPVSPILSPSSAQFSFSRILGNRAVSSPQSVDKPAMTDLQGPVSPVVTKLDFAKALPTADSENSSANPSPSPASHNFSFFAKPRMGGLRIASDIVTQNEKRTQSKLKGSPITSPTRTGSTTPSTDTRSFDLQKPDQQSRVSTGSSGLAPPPPATRSRPKTKSKKTTSAYTRGLEKKSPAEQMAGCDYSGWMKKKSSNLVGTWKPRLFVLRGRRLSYYYSENDTEEKGLIDISSHRVLPAENERLTGMVATLTGATSSPIAPQNATTTTSAAADLKANPSLHPDLDQGLFIFKLVPPRQGLSKAVNFTKPTVHYFAVNSRQEGRLWMAALMKATIDYDASGKVVTSYNQTTISLAKARARKERPPALQDVSDEDGDVSDDKKFVAELDGDGDARTTRSDSTGLGIAGYDVDKDPAEHNALSGAVNDGKQHDSINGSTHESTDLREAIASV